MSEEAKTESIFLEVNLGAWAGTKCPEKKLYIKKIIYESRKFDHAGTW